MIDNLFLSVGAMKAGTTWLYQQLKVHPEIYFTPEKEIHFFANFIGIENQLSHRNRIIKLQGLLSELHAKNPKYVSNNIDKLAWYVRYAQPKELTVQWYRRLFEDNTGKKICADFSNLYCQMPNEGWDVVRRTGRNLKVIYTLRNPLDRLWSHYKFHMKWLGKQEKDVLNAGFDAFKETLDKRWFFANAEYATNYEVLNRNLSGNELKILYFEDFRAEPQREINNVLEFLDLEPFAQQSPNLRKKINSTKEVGFPPKWKEYSISLLDNELTKMRSLGIWHPAWEMEL